MCFIYLVSAGAAIAGISWSRAMLTVVLAAGSKRIRGYIPMLTFASIHGQLHGVAIGPMKCLIPVQDGLHRVLTRRNVRDTSDGIAKCFGVHGADFAGAPTVDIDAKDNLRVRRITDLKPRFLGRIVRKQE
jgi:hypothetical protein